MITILIPTIGKSHWIATTLETCAQSSRELTVEVLLVTPILSESLKRELDRILRKYFPDTSRIIQTDKPGIVEALNLGIRNAKYEYISRIDDDDTMQESRLQKQIDFLESNPNYAAVGSFTNVINAEGKILYKQNFPVKFEEIQADLAIGNAVSHPSVTFRKSAVIAVGGYKNEYVPAEDYELWVRLCKYGKIANIPEYLTSYRIHENQSTQVNLSRIHVITKSIIYQQYLNHDALNFRELEPSDIVKYVESASPSNLVFREKGNTRPKNRRDLVALATISLARSLFVDYSQNRNRIVRQLVKAFIISPIFTFKFTVALLHSKILNKVIGSREREL